ncbi:DNA ligase (ATP) [Termitomyces sp. T159_Od127]|nr:DNA ligase (ATP) [Termitomyces sp. T159_Od127]
MLCKRPTKKIEDTVKEMGGSEFFIEEKLDGERMQLHKRGNEFFYCSRSESSIECAYEVLTQHFRKGKDYTYLYGKHVGTGSLTPFIDKAFDPRIDDIILDGEMLVWDPISERNLPFGTLKTAALDRSKKEHNPRPCFKVFDLLYLNGQSLLERSTVFRKKNLRSCLKEIKGRIEFAVEYKGKTAKAIRERMDEVMAARGEGLVIKHPQAKYVLNGRNMDWIKVKPEYMDNMGETVDVLVVAGNYGSGKRGGGVSTLICAVLDDRRPSEEDDEPKYSSFVRIGSGLSFADYVWVREKPWKIWDAKRPPEFLLTSKRSHEDKGDVYLEPADSFILKVKAAEIVPSDQYDMGFTMRFPRALAIRDDLSIADCMTATEIMESIRSEKKRKMESDTGQPVMLPEYQGPRLKGVAVTSRLFEGMKFVVMSDPKSRTGDQDRKDLMKLYFFHAKTERVEADDFEDAGMEVDEEENEATLSPASQTEKDSPAPPAKEEQSDAVKDEQPDDPDLADWFKVGDMKQEEDMKYESVTDADSDNADVAGEDDDLDDWFNINNSSTEPPPSAEPESSRASSFVDVTMGETEDAMEYDQEKIFRHLCFYLDSPENAQKNGLIIKSKNEAALTKSFAELYMKIIENGGKVVDLTQPKLTHIIIDKRDDSRRLELMKRTSKPKRRHLVVSEFIQACLEEETLLDEEDFVP